MKFHEKLTFIAQLLDGILLYLSLASLSKVLDESIVGT